MAQIKLKKILSLILKKKYLITIIIFTIWIIFFDKSNIISLIKYNNTLKKLETEKIFYQNKVYTDSVKLEQLKTNDKNLEKFAREQYLMHKPNEDIFIIIE